MTARSRHIAGTRAGAALLVLATLAAAPACTNPPSADAVDDSPARAGGRAEPVRATGALTLSEEEIRTGGITVGVPRRETRASEFTASAVLQLDDTRTARLGSIVDGVIVDASVQVGARVQRGERLASIHSHMVHETWADYRRALAERRRTTTELAFVREAEGRAFRLLATKAASRQEAERARTDRAAAEEALVIAESEVRRALDELEHLGIEPDADPSTASVEAVPVTATLDGVVLERLVTAGTAVTTGTPLFVVSNLSRLWAIAEIDETRLPSVAVGRAAELTVSAYPGRTFQGRIVAIGDSVNPDTRRVTARVEVGNTGGSLKPQMFATVHLPTGDEQPVLMVPLAAVQKVDQQAVVFVEQEAGRFVQRPVVPGPEREGEVEIREGLESGERIAVAGTFLLKSKFLESEPSE